MDDLQHLLAKVDADAPPVRADLANTVRQVVVRRRRNRRVITSVSTILAIGTIAISAITPRSRPIAHPTVVQAVDAAAFRREVAELDRNAELHARIGLEIEKALAQNAELIDARKTLAQPSAIVQLDGSRQIAAQLMLRHAKQIETDPKQGDDAIASYRNLAALFPETVAGREAVLRLHPAGV